jgi:hypothetical protein
VKYDNKNDISSKYDNNVFDLDDIDRVTILAHNCGALL